MRRWLAILLLVLLPLQSTWAAVASYCAHAAAGAVDHGGHHGQADTSHADHGVVPEQPVSSDSASCVLSGMGCGHCHGHGAGMLSVASGFVPAAHGGAPSAATAVPGAEHLPAQPERPQWARLA
ncbi:hypothetical protein [Pseudaquabacterium pictum]|uniref:Cobalt transporter n=1 Tax=Pseudaquabacterium pictum TaxID=2315236 RepID=A0A480ASX3_9BURK|nr:hypothetical protein [Rubrivivax pictus]GCL64789.1 hypothetical protein AQPW35_38700 [Rubrivivax pictus]